MNGFEIRQLKEGFTVHECPKCGWRIPIKVDGYSFHETENRLKDEYIAELELLIRDMMELDQIRHGPFSWERIERMQDIRGSVNARLIKMGFVQEVDHAETD